MKYEHSHPWIRFKAELQQAPTLLWLMLGECESKATHLANVPLRPSTAKELHTLYLAKGIQATTAIEGNTLTEAQVKDYIEGKLHLPPSQAYLQQEVENVRRACNRITEQVAQGNATDLTENSIKALNSLLLEGLENDDDVVPGAFRLHSVVVGSVYRGPPAEDVPYLMDRLCSWLNGSEFQAPDEFRDFPIVFALLEAIIAHVYLAWIHPFGDGNGRTARLVEFQILLNAGVPAPAAHLLSNHYNQTRSQYYRELDKASKSGGDILPFIMYAVRGFLDGIRGQLKFVWNQQWDVTWRNYVHDLFKDKNKDIDTRQRRLVLALSREEAPVARDKLTSLTPELARAYAGKHDRMLTRDLNALEKLELIVEVERGEYRAAREIILGYLPVQFRE